MLSLDKVIAGAKVRGLAGEVPVEVVRTEWIGADALNVNVVYRGAASEMPSRGSNWCRRPEPSASTATARHSGSPPKPSVSGSRICSIPTSRSTELAN
jgi:hypothetical protein